MELLLRRTQYPVDRAYQLFPAAGLLGELLAPRSSQPVVAGLAVVFGSAPERSDPATILETMQSRVQRAMFDLQDGIGAVFDHVRDGVSVGRAEHERLQNQ